MSTKAFFTNAEFRFAAYLSSLSDIPAICIWDFGDSTVRQYSQNKNEIVHFYDKPGFYRAVVQMIDASTLDTIGDASVNLFISENVHDSLLSIVQGMNRVSISFLSDKKYSNSDQYATVEKDRQNYTYSSSLVFYGLNGAHDYSDGSGSLYTSSQTDSKGHAFLHWEGGALLDTLYVSSDYQEIQGSADGHNYDSKHLSIHLTAVRIPLLLVRKDSIVFELSGDTLKKYCEMSEDYYYTQGGYGSTGGFYRLDSIDWNSTVIIPKLRIVLTK